MNKKRLLYILLGIALIFILITTIYFSSYIQPKIIFSAEITTVSNEDYDRILTNQQVMHDNKNIENFKQIYIEIKVKEPIGVNNIKIERYILQQYLKDNKNIQVLGGGSLEHGNGKEYSENIEIYLIDLSIDQFIDSLKDFKYKVTWNDIWNKSNDKVFYLKDYLKVRS